MGRMRVRHAGVTRLAADMRIITKVEAPRDLKEAVRESVSYGGRTARALARGSSGKHAKQYPGKITWDRRVASFGAAEVNLFSGEYGPEPVGQGRLAPILERGSRNNPPHHDLAKSADRAGHNFAGKIALLPDEWFW